MQAENTERELVKRLVEKQQSAWKELYQSYSGRLAYACSRYLSNEDDVQDVLQESFIKMYHSIDSFEYRGEGSLRAWLTRIVINDSIKYLKKKTKINHTEQVDELPELVEQEDTDFLIVPQKVILEMIQSLPEGYRMVFNLYVFEEKSHKEIGSILGIAENSSASQYHRAKNILARKITEYKKLNMAHYE
ncbi:RNA polymerase sigma factor [Myroides injenensis]|uniref:RNA polymerase sigma factor n=1 Tax=Myroides injenensis TaxID=1183151 RepID=UPI000289AED2|nr:RNA polymerase sigma factor [Myroides injenensis]